MDITGLGSLFKLGTTIIDKIWPDKVEYDKDMIGQHVMAGILLRKSNR